MYDKVSEYLSKATTSELIEVFELMSYNEMHRIFNLLYNRIDSGEWPEIATKKVKEKSEYQDAKEIDDAQRYRDIKATMDRDRY